MRKLIILITIICSSVNITAQQLQDSLKNLSAQELGNYHLQKSRDAKTGAILLAGLGLGTFIIGGTVISNSEKNIFDPDFDKEVNTMLTVTAVGSALVIVSIPLAISALSHKQKANDLLGNKKSKKSLSIKVNSSKIPTGYAHQAIPLKSIGFNLAF